MSASRRMYVRVLRHYEDWVEVNAVDDEEARELAVQEPGVSVAMDVQDEEPEGWR